MKNAALFDNYLNNKLSAEEKALFENRLTSDEVFAQAFSEHKTLINALNAHNNTLNFKEQLKAIHKSEFGDGKVISINKETFAKRHGKTLAVAASTAIIAVLSTVAILSTGGYLLKKQSSELQELSLQLKAQSDGIVEGLTRGVAAKTVYAPANMEGSAFALNNKGYIVTSLHVITGADSVFIQNKNTERTLAKVVLTDPKLDLAILKIENTDVTKTWQIPFSFSNKTTDIGEKVFTLGYPRKDVVYGEGSLSSLTGYTNDTCMYQVSIPVNPGNSGGPLLDDQGSVIGFIHSKIAAAEGTGFAIKSSEIIKSISQIGADTIQIAASKKPALKNVKRTEQIKRINPYVFNVLVYKKD